MSEQKEARKLVWLKLNKLVINHKILVLLVTGIFLAPQIALVSRSSEKATMAIFVISYSATLLHTVMFFLALEVIKDLLRQKKT